MQESMNDDESRLAALNEEVAWLAAALAGALAENEQLKRIIASQNRRECVGCGATFLPSHGSQTHCDKGCAMRHRMRRYRARNADRV
jgi:hypothetical protein